MTGRRGHGDGGIDEPIPGHYRLRWRVDGRRFSKMFKGSLAEARRELRRLLKTADDGEYVAPSKITVADHLRGWLADATDISPKTRERYLQLAEHQIIPHLGTTVLQQLETANVRGWHKVLIDAGLSARTVGHAHRVLHRALEIAVTDKLIAANVARRGAIKPPKVQEGETEILSPAQIATVRAGLAGHWLLPIVELALGTGMRRGELCALTWGAVDLAKGTAQVRASLEETASGLRLKEPKTKHGRRTIALGKAAATALRDHSRQQVELRLRLGLGRPQATDYVFPKPGDATFQAWPPDQLSRDWARIVSGKRRGLPRVSFHALRHTHASMLIAAGLDVVSICRRLGHGRPSVTLDVYGHLIERNEDKMVAALDAALGSG
jgi:integrase